MRIFWLQSTRCFLEPRVAILFFLGVSSGLPFLLILSTLSIWLTEAGITKTQIGLLAWVTVPYALKFCWAPIIESLRLPFLTTLLGFRRGWLVFIQFILMFSIIGLGNCHPENSLVALIFWAFMVSFSSACQDILIEAYRMESLPESYVGLGAGASVIGYRVGMMISGAGALYLATTHDWATVYNCMAAFVLVGAITTLCCAEPEGSNKKINEETFYNNQQHSFSLHNGLLQKIKRAIVLPYSLFVQRRDWILVFFLILFFKACDTSINSMSSPFLIEIGFTKTQIAEVAKTFGILAMMVGGALGGILLTKVSVRRLVFVCMVLQMVACIFFMIQAMVGPHIKVLFLTMGIESVTSGLSQVVLIVYLSNLCHKQFRAVHFAALSSLSSIDRVGITMLSGWLADQVTWVQFFVVAATFCLPALFILYRYDSHFSEISTSEPKVVVSNQARVVAP